MSVGITQSVYRPESKGWTSQPELCLVSMPSRLFVAARWGLIAGSVGVLVLLVVLAVKA